MFSELDDIFKKYSNRNIIMKWTDKDFSNLLDDLQDYFRSDDDVTEFMATNADEYAKKYNIDFVEPEEFDFEIDPDVIPGEKSDFDLKQGAAASDGITSFDEIKRLKELAGLWEDEDEDGEEEYEPEESDSEIISQDYMLTFNSPEDRDQAIMYFKDPHNHPREVQKYTRGRLCMQPEDAVSIKFPTMENYKKCGLDERKLKGIIEIMHRVINKKFPNSKTMKMETK
jgi:hypothetical protein